MLLHTRTLSGSLCLVVLLPALCGFAATANLTVAADTFINSGSPGNNAGATAWIDAGRDGAGGVRRGLLRFDLSSIPAGSTITSATLQLTVVRVPNTNPINSTFDLFRLLANWTEGAKTGNSGAPATAGEATWNARMQGTANWTTPGAKSDAAAAASASMVVTAADNATYSWSGAGLTADVQLWVNSPSQNFGWLLASRAENTSRSVRGFASGESGANVGTLVVNYTPPAGGGAPPTVSITSPANGATFASPATVTIQATAADSDGTVAQVEFFDGASSLGVDTSAPYSVTAPLSAGAHVLTAVATDNTNEATTSDAVTVTVTSEAIDDPIAAPIVFGDIRIDLELVIDGLTAPLGLAVPDDGTKRMFVYDQVGLAWVVVNGSEKLPTPLLDVRSRLVTFGAYDERGLLGLATHPDFANHPLVYTYTSEPNDDVVADFVAQMPPGTTIDHQSVIAEWRMDPNDPNRVDPNSRREILRIDKPQANHNGGTLRFGPDGFLYISLGDGGFANDVAPGHAPGGNAQDLQRIWGKLLRIDVDRNNSANGKYGIPADNPFVGQNAVQEVYAYGLRNPYTYSFDRLTGDLYLGDAGQNNIEEVDLIVKGGNYGWNIKEGSFWFDPNTGDVVSDPVRPVPPGLIDPIAEFDHDEGAVVIGGFVYRGTAVPALQGLHVFGSWGFFDAPTARLFYFDPNSPDPNTIIRELRIGRADRPTGFWLRGFGEDACGELYVFGSTTLGPQGNTGQMFRITRCLPMTYHQENLVSDLPGTANHTDRNLVNPWGIATGSATPFWISNAETGVSTIYDGDGVEARPPVTIPTAAGGTPPGHPTGIVSNPTGDFLVAPGQPAHFIFATEDGTISGWNNGNAAVRKVDLSASETIYKGLALAAAAGGNYLYATDFHNGKVDVFDADFNPAVLPGSFADPTLPAGFAPFGIHNIGGELFVTYAQQDADAEDDVAGPGLGYVNVFDPNGVLLRRFASACHLNAPWAVVSAPAGFGGFAGALLIGNFGDGRINAFHPVTGEFLGTVLDAQANPIEIEGLWGLIFGNGGRGGDLGVLYFTAGIDDEAHGLFGKLVPVPLE